MSERSAGIALAALPCPTCQYDVSRAPEDRCPECGSPFDRAKLLHAPQAPIPPSVVGSLYIVLAVACQVVVLFGVPQLSWSRGPSDTVSVAVFASVFIGAPLGLSIVFAARAHPLEQSFRAATPSHLRSLASTGDFIEMRITRSVLPAAAVVTAWFGMQAIHELGHVIGAWATRAEIQNVNLHPLELSRTDLGMNPHPLLVVWAGPLLGVLLPLALWGTAAALRLKHAFLLRFFAGFCLLANGAYIGVGSLARVGDCREMLLHGSPIWVLWIFGLAGFGSGIMVLHGLGVPFGIASADTSPPRGSLARCLVALCALLLLGVAVGS